MNKKSILAVSTAVIIIISPFLFLYIYKYKIENDSSIKINFVDLRKANLTDTLNYNLPGIKIENDFYIMEILSNTNFYNKSDINWMKCCSEKEVKYDNDINFFKDSKNIIYIGFTYFRLYSEKQNNKIFYGIAFTDNDFNLKNYDSLGECIYCKIFLVRMFYPIRQTDYFTIPKDSLKVLLKTK